MEPTELLARYVAELCYDRVPEPVRRIARRAFVDTIACAIAGAGEPAARIARNLLLEDAGAARATVIAASRGGGCAAKMPPANAAMANAIAGHALDYDDVNAMGHPSVPVCFTALAAAEDTQAAGRDLLLAYVAGVELETKVNRAFSESHYLHGWHSTSTVGVLGAAAAAARIYRLDAAQAAAALGIAASQAAGLRRNFGTMTKPFHPGHASWAGLNAARLARAGFSADSAILDAEYGYYPVFSAGPYQVSRAVANLDQWALLKPGLSVKKYPCCYCTHASIDAALALKERFGVKPPAVRSIVAEVSPFYLSPLIHHRPSTGLEGKFSLEYTVAAALLDSRVTLASFRDEMVVRPEAQELIGKLSSRAYDRGEQGLAATFARLTVELSDGRRLVEEVLEPRGAASNPMSDREIEAKFLDCWSSATNGAAGAECRQALAALWRIDRLENVAELTRHLG
jgi:2-methylcitrate dehydratase PrpD